MALTPLSASVNIHQTLPDEPNDVGGMTAAQLKAAWDTPANTLKEYLNGTLIPELDAAHLPYLYGSAGTVQNAMDGLVAGVVPDGSITAAMLKSGIVAYSNLGSDVIEIFNTLILNNLRLKLQVSLSHADIDAYSDLLADSSLMDIPANPSTYVSAGSLAAGMGGGTASGSVDVKSNSVGIAGQTFIPGVSTTITSATIALRAVGVDSPGRATHAYIYNTSNGLPTTVLYTSPTTAYATNTTGNLTFSFSNASVISGTTYALVISTASGPSEYPNQLSTTGGSYSGGNRVYADSSDTTWTSVPGSDLYFVLKTMDGEAFWSGVETSEALSCAAVTADTTPGTGTVAWYLSDDGTDWTAVTAEDTMQTVSFDTAFLHLKCVLTGNATVEAVAYGGY
ncbi:hypothetical protein [Papillibacter cinnamivorans]|uniref:Uncharacterized protein n=1 Tax=Papillibacter cinnamivorans DSM 12816 TaxID=1122930 RepID=A0A1W2C6G2_9FIRM|nr:hypothetical protein [Papillibacter cinnamivorans]SMC80462.1 hypothetical protein SAMN02745168_2574 [Papillibacter cinnamivorans DSM 12816]